MIFSFAHIYSIFSLITLNANIIKMEEYNEVTIFILLSIFLDFRFFTAVNYYVCTDSKPGSDISIVGNCINNTMILL